MNITLVVPTLNRPDHLLCLVKYYDLVGFTGRLIIGDSSDLSTFNKVNIILQKYSNRLAINHIHLPSLTPAEVMRDVSHLIITDYVCCLPDDDFLVTNGIQECIDFLSSNHDFVAAHGKGYVAHQNLVKPNVFSFIPYKQAIAEEAHNIDRVFNYLENYSVSLFSVMRVEKWVEIFSKIPYSSIDPKVSDRAFMDELLPNVMLVASGKVKELENIYLVRQDHDGRYLLPDWFSWIMQPIWSSTYIYFRKTVLDEIYSGLKIVTVDQSKKFDYSFSIYLKKFILQDQVSFLEFRSFLSHFPLLKNLFIKIKSILFNTKNLFKKNTPYHKDFKIIIKVISERKKLI